MAKVNICDMCKKPEETNFRLILFRKNGKKHEDKEEKDICERCNKLLRNNIDENLSPVMQTTKEIFKLETNTSAPLVGDGVYKVPSTLSIQQIRAANKVSENNGCKHEKKTVDDDSGRVICRDCKKPIEDL